MEKLKEALQSTYSENKLEEFSIKTKRIYDSLNREFILKDIPKNQEKFTGFKVWINPQYTGSVVTNITKVEMNQLIPTMIPKLIRTNLSGFNEVYSLLLDMWVGGFRDSRLKEYLNMSWGCLGNPNSIIYSNNIQNIINKINSLLRSIQEEFIGHIIYIDVDTIYFRNFEEIEKKFLLFWKKINKYGLTWEGDSIKFGIFMGLKKYIIHTDDSLIKIKGISLYNEEGLNRGGTIQLGDKFNNI
jgi:hypothetical protein